MIEDGDAVRELSTGNDNGQCGFFAALRMTSRLQVQRPRF
jgi:hypothetical protein